MKLIFFAKIVEKYLKLRVNYSSFVQFIKAYASI